MHGDGDEIEFVVFGTSLPEIDDDAIVKKKPHDLSVRDEKGRQRFHGAFTGGFSAGYFNSVGTKEGWTPAVYVSSRSKKSTPGAFQQNPEDFMDDEDFSVFGIAPKTIHTTSNFRDEDNVKKRKRVDEIDAVIPGEAPLKELVRPVVDSIGVAILKKLGWRRGQGIGPRIRKSANINTIGCSLGPLGPDMPKGEEWDSVLFAPEDASDVAYLPKDDLHGLGYTGLSTSSVLTISLPDSLSGSVTKTFLTKDRKKLSIRGQAFGVGALEEDDDDIYHKDDMSQYDFTEFLGGKKETKSSQRKKSEKQAGSDVLEGFSLAKNPLMKKKYFPPPDLPANFRPKCPFKPDVSAKLPAEVTRGQLNPAVRSIMLGEKIFQKAAPSFEKKSEGRRSRFDQPPSIPTDACVSTAPKLLTSPTLETPLGLQMSSKFKPFSKDESKQTRYDDFLKHGCDKEYLKSIQPHTLTDWEKHQEINEFLKTAAFFKPLPQELESRFESRSHLAVELNSGISKAKKKTDSDASIKPKNARAVRELFEWHPASILCKRFNVPNPYPDSKTHGVPQVEKKKLTLFNCLDFDDSSLESHPAAKDEDHVETSEKIITEVSSATKELARPSGEENIEIPKNISFDSESAKIQEKPPIDIFKSIFLSSSSEDSDNEDKATKTETVTSSAPPSIVVEPRTETVTVVSKEYSDTNNASKQAFGVFANLDLDALNKRTSVPRIEKPATAPLSDANCNDSDSASHSVEQKTSISVDVYGPELPPVVPNARYWPVLQAEVGHSKHRHKHHKHKTRKKKKEKKKRKSKKARCEEVRDARTSDSSDSSVNSDEDISSERILYKLKKLKRLEGKHKNVH